jgi:hypothetical protein
MAGISALLAAPGERDRKADERVDEDSIRVHSGPLKRVAARYRTPTDDIQPSMTNGPTPRFGKLRGARPVWRRRHYLVTTAL